MIAFDKEDDTDKNLQNELLSGCKKTQYAMRFKLETEKILMESNQVSLFFEFKRDLVSAHKRNV
jgi:hypothetical protein